MGVGVVVVPAGAVVEHDPAFRMADVEGPGGAVGEESEEGGNVSVVSIDGGEAAPKHEFEESGGILPLATTPPPPPPSLRRRIPSGPCTIGLKPYCSRRVSLCCMANCTASIINDGAPEGAPREVVVCDIDGEKKVENEHEALLPVPVGAAGPPRVWGGRHPSSEERSMAASGKARRNCKSGGMMPPPPPSPRRGGGLRVPPMGQEEFDAEKDGDRSPAAV